VIRGSRSAYEGYAAAGSDTGHEQERKLAINNLDAQNNYAYLATHVVTLIGKQILRTFYNQHERRSISWAVPMAARWRLPKFNGTR